MNTGHVLSSGCARVCVWLQKYWSDRHKRRSAQSNRTELNWTELNCRVLCSSQFSSVYFCRFVGLHFANWTEHNWTVSCHESDGRSQLLEDLGKYTYVAARTTDLSSRASIVSTYVTTSAKSCQLSGFSLHELISVNAERDASSVVQVYKA